ncbi:MAG: hypothetical protein MI785_01835 [Kiloniellales bacterium]|nr:hypothetical protein [Kiloniellales bacterium]
MGIPGDYGDEKVVQAYERVIAACRRHGKHPGMGGVYAPELARRYVDMGMRLILTGSDFAFLMAGAKAQAASFRGML